MTPSPGIKSPDTLVGGECSHHCPILAPQILMFQATQSFHIVIQNRLDLVKLMGNFRFYSDLSWFQTLFTILFISLKACEWAVTVRQTLVIAKVTCSYFETSHLIQVTKSGQTP